jgi:UPF0042 nucleotide-binding protein
MRLVLITGMSGAGKSVALRTLEDSGFEAIDNMPLAFLPAVVGAHSGDLAVGLDVRSRGFSTDDFLKEVSSLRDNAAVELSIVFLDADDEVLRRRYSETRRRHPLALDRTVPDGIHRERELIGGLRDTADLMIDTSDLEVAALREMVTRHFSDKGQQLSVVLTSFGFRHGLPREADMVFDVRFLRNPHYDPMLKVLTGLDARVGAYVEEDKDFAGFFERLCGVILPLLPRYAEEGKHYLTIAIGCTGGHHRSVHTVEKLGAFLLASGYNVTLRHRDIGV